MYTTERAFFSIVVDISVLCHINFEPDYIKYSEYTFVRLAISSIFMCFSVKKCIYVVENASIAIASITPLGKWRRK